VPSLPTRTSLPQQCITPPGLFVHLHPRNLGAGIPSPLGDPDQAEGTRGNPMRHNRRVPVPVPVPGRRGRRL